MKLFIFKACCRFVIAFGSCWIASGMDAPETPWKWSLLLIGCLVSAAVSVEAYVSKSSSELP